MLAKSKCQAMLKSQVFNKIMYQGKTEGKTHHSITRKNNHCFNTEDRISEDMNNQGKTENSYAAVPLIKQQGYIIENNPT